MYLVFTFKLKIFNMFNKFLGREFLKLMNLLVNYFEKFCELIIDI